MNPNPDTAASLAANRATLPPRPVTITPEDGCECGCHPNYETVVRRCQRTGYFPPADPDDTSHLGCYYCSTAIGR
ncbi:hypothetical protein [Candidatus Poriferisocius sp.]|uniref:hypothetical protein n=1 Tax=Candidatus Poriferisocius sp. TaxID=3101276 RepID=UPI003B026048